MSITLLRHAAVANELQGCYLGWSDVSIDEQLFDESKVAIFKEISFDVIISSDLLRCRQTVEKLGKRFRTDRRLREVKFKPHIEGKRFAEVEKLESYDTKYLASESTWHTYICEEPKVTFRKRIEDFLTTLPKDKEVLICSHAGTIKEIMAILGKEIEILQYLEYKTYELQHMV